MSFWTDIANGEVALSVRNKINNLGNKAVSLWDKTVVSEPTLAKYGLGAEGTVDDVLDKLSTETNIGFPNPVPDDVYKPIWIKYADGTFDYWCEASETVALGAQGVWYGVSDLTAGSIPFIPKRIISVNSSNNFWIAGDVKVIDGAITYAVFGGAANHYESVTQIHIFGTYK